MRFVWTCGCTALWLHVALAFAFYHHWSHQLAYDDTARQTQEAIGVWWGGGVFANYLVMLIWLAHVVGWWVQGNPDWAGPLGSRFMQGSLAFVFFNATVVFEDGLIRWLGALGTAGLLVVWYVGRMRSKPRTTQS